MTILNKGIFFYDVCLASLRLASAHSQIQTQQCVASLVVPPSLALTGLAVVSDDSSELCVSADYTNVMYYRSKDKLMTGKLSHTNATVREVSESTLCAHNQSKKPIHALFPLWSRQCMCVVYNDGGVLLLSLPDLQIVAEIASDRLFPHFARFPLSLNSKD